MGATPKISTSSRQLVASYFRIAFHFESGVNNTPAIPPPGTMLCCFSRLDTCFGQLVVPPPAAPIKPVHCSLKYDSSFISFQEDILRIIDYQRNYIYRALRLKCCFEPCSNDVYLNGNPRQEIAYEIGLQPSNMTKTRWTGEDALNLSRIMPFLIVMFVHISMGLLQKKGLCLQTLSSLRRTYTRPQGAMGRCISKFVRLHEA